MVVDASQLKLDRGASFIETVTSVYRKFKEIDYNFHKCIVPVMVRFDEFEKKLHVDNQI